MLLTHALSPVFQQINMEPGPNAGGAPTLRLFSVMEVRYIVISAISVFHLTFIKAGHSVLTHITGFLPYFYVATPRGFASDDLEPFREYINTLTEPGMLHLVEVVQKRSL